MRKLLIVSTAAIFMGFSGTAFAEGVANPPEGTLAGGGYESEVCATEVFTGAQNFGQHLSGQVGGWLAGGLIPGTSQIVPQTQYTVQGPGPGIGDHFNANQLNLCGVGRNASPANQPLP